jgi:hypothetical protein
MNFFNTVYVSCPLNASGVDMDEAEVKQYLKRYEELEPRLSIIYVRFLPKETTVRVLARRLIIKRYHDYKEPDKVLTNTYREHERKFLEFTSSPNSSLSAILEQVFIKYIFK